MVARKPPGQRALSQAEKDLWTHVTKDVTPSDADNTTFVAALEQPSDHKMGIKKRSPKVRAKLPPPELPELNGSPGPSSPPSLSPGQTDMMDKRTARRLKRGQLGIDARLDLHGHVQATAHRALESFLERSFYEGHRTVLVITGKGNRGTGQVGVLKEAVPRWLNQMPIRDWVTGFSYAAVKDGGDGALYIRIKRRR